LKGLPVGHQVEYFAKLSPPLAKQWLSGFEGFWFEPEESGELPYGEFHLWEDQYLHADLAEQGSWLRMPRIKYSWLIGGHQESIRQIERLERLMAESLPCVLIVRVDEFLHLLWEAEEGRSWDGLPDPVGSLRDWLITSKQDPSYYKIVCDSPSEA
jgi:hypothetical protein